MARKPLRVALRQGAQAVGHHDDHQRKMISAMVNCQEMVQDQRQIATDSIWLTISGGLARRLCEPTLGVGGDAADDAPRIDNTVKNDMSWLDDRLERARRSLHHGPVRRTSSRRRIQFVPQMNRPVNKVRAGKSHQQRGRGFCRVG